MMRKLMMSIIATVLLSATTALATNSGNIDVIVTNKKVDFNYQYDGVRVGMPFIEDNRTFIPLRVVSENLGYKVDWNQETQTAIVSKGSNEVKIKIGDNFALVNGVKTYIDIQSGKPVNTRAQLKNSRTYVPVRFISEAMGDKVDYRQPSTSSVKNKTVYINSDNLPVEGPAKPTPTPIQPDPTSSVTSSTPIKTTKEDTLIKRYSYTTNLSNGLQIYEVAVYKPGPKSTDVLGSVGFKNVDGGVYGYQIKSGYELGKLISFRGYPNLTSEDYETIKQAFIQVHDIYKAGK